MPVFPQQPTQQPPRHEVIYEHPEHRGTAEPAESSRHEQGVTNATLTGGSALELVGGGGAVVLAIIGLSGYLPLYMTAISTIAIGGALLVHGALAMGRWSDTVRRVAARNERSELAGGLSSEMFGGACGIVLGILALAGVVPLILLAVAAIVLGGSVLIAAPAEPDLAKLASDRTNPKADHLTYEAVEGSSGAMILAGIGSIVLGILALLRIGPPLTLVLVAMLALGGAVFLGGTALTARFARRLQHAT